MNVRNTFVEKKKHRGRMAIRGGRGSEKLVGILYTVKKRIPFK